MQREYKKAFSTLNKEQREAVETINGPVLVIAGPGTGKTQLIGTRVGYILQMTDAQPSNILCLTFTEAGVEAMRQRLMSLIGNPAYEINLSTYHAFGSELIRRYPDFFEEVDVNPIDDLGIANLIQTITQRLPFDNPLRYSESYFGDIISFISDSKRALLTPTDIRQVAKTNLMEIDMVNKTARGALDSLGVISKKSVPVFSNLLQILQNHRVGKTRELPDAISPLSSYAAVDLEAALSEYHDSGKTTFLTVWKNNWLAKDDSGRFVFDGQRLNQKINAAAEVYERYQNELQKRRLYDYDDMILRAITALESYPDFKYSLAEQYQYIMLDEFQDTNPAQFRLIELLTDHPVNEERPNVLAVGDDDQAIYAFQGADHANMLNFTKRYRDVKIISLKENYRSSTELITVGQNIVAQITERLHHNFPKVRKRLESASARNTQKLEAWEFQTDGAQYEWLASEIQALIKEGIKPREIAVLAPKHRYLVLSLPYFARAGIAVHYEKRENILDSTIIKQLEQMARLTLALGSDNRLADALWPEVLSYDFWRVPSDKIWRLSWQSEKLDTPWTETILKEKTTRQIGLFFLRLKDILSTTALELQLDTLIGSADHPELAMPIKSPLYEYYFVTKRQKDPLAFTKLLSNLNVLRARLRDHMRSQEGQLGLDNFISFIDSYRAAGLTILDTNPYFESEDSVNLMTAYGAKGNEFAAVFIIAAVDEVWGSASRNLGYRIALPANLKFMRYQGASEDERLRLLFVAATRAKTNLYFSGYQKSLDGRNMTRLKYLQIKEGGDHLTSRIMPPPYDEIQRDGSKQIDVRTMEDYWSSKHLPPYKPELKELLAPKLTRYQLTASHLNQFTDIVNYGPEYFFLNCLLRFPSAPVAEAAYGTAVHNTIRWLGGKLIRSRSLPKVNQFLAEFNRQLTAQRLSEAEFAAYHSRAELALPAWYAQKANQLKPTDRFEYSFRNRPIVIGDALINGKIDLLKIDERRRAISIIDYKTGRAYRRWTGNSLKLHRFRQQLLTYKLLVENTTIFRGYRLDKVAVEFVEPDEKGEIVQLDLNESAEELEFHKQLLIAVWRSVKALELPDVSKYAPTIVGVRQFETDIIGAGGQSVPTQTASDTGLRQSSRPPADPKRK